MMSVYSNRRYMSLVMRNAIHPILAHLIRRHTSLVYRIGVEPASVCACIRSSQYSCVREPDGSLLTVYGRLGPPGGSLRTVELQ